jgi:hypothetical protein
VTRSRYLLRFATIAVILALAPTLAFTIVRANRTPPPPPLPHAPPAPSHSPTTHPSATTPTGLDLDSTRTIALGDSVLGLSGKLRIHLVHPAQLSPTLGALPLTPGVYPVPGGVDGHPFAIITLRDFSAKIGPWVGDYHLGYWPAERHLVRSRAYANPIGFVEVTPANEDTYVSAHFRLRDFLTHDQPRIWPKYVVLREALLDKLELVLDDLARRGISTEHVEVLSGFRTPAYNLALGDASGRARESRHQFGDAADIIIDADRNGRMDDLDANGRIDAGDVRVIERAVRRVERRYPELAGGLGLYEAMGPHGPFAHIDVRGEVARWMRSAQRAPGPGTGSPSRAAPVARCYATGRSAVLCLGVRRRGS